MDTTVIETIIELAGQGWPPNEIAYEIDARLRDADDYAIYEC